jgi:TPR repeat protein
MSLLSDAYASQKTPVSGQRATYWAMRAAEAGDPQGWLVLGFEYDTGKLGGDPPYWHQMAMQSYRKAADGGTVVYVGSEVAHLGNLVLVQHPGGYITAYGNNEAVLVKKGEEVKKGETIAKAGSSGGAASPRLHFEVRRGGSRTIDPMTVLPAQ